MASRTVYDCDCCEAKTVVTEQVSFVSGRDSCGDDTHESFDLCIHCMAVYMAFMLKEKGLTKVNEFYRDLQYNTKPIYKQWKNIR